MGAVFKWRFFWSLLTLKDWRNEGLMRCSFEDLPLTHPGHWSYQSAHSATLVTQSTNPFSRIHALNQLPGRDLVTAYKPPHSHLHGNLGHFPLICPCQLSPNTDAQGTMRKVCVCCTTCLQNEPWHSTRCHERELWPASFLFAPVIQHHHHLLSVSPSVLLN